MTPGQPQSLYRWASGPCVGLLVFAFVAAPHACAWGLDAYFWSGVAVVLALLAMPFAIVRMQSLLRRALSALGLAALGSIVWIAGLFLADFPIICRMF